MKLHRMYAIILRNLYNFRRSFDRITDAFWWPTIDILIWGLTSSFFTAYAPHSSMVVLMLISGILLWLITHRVQYEIDISLLEDIWNKNLINLFVSPLTLLEWIFSLLSIGLIKVAASFLFALLLAFLLFQIKIFFFGFYFIPFILLLMMTGWWISFFVAGLILHYGSKVQAFAWTIVFVISPFSAIYYPVSILPTWAQKIAMFIPTSYVFEGMRAVINKGSFSVENILISFALNLIFLIASLIYLKLSFNKMLEKGMTKVY